MAKLRGSMAASEASCKEAIRIACDLRRCVEKERDALQAKVDSLIGTLKLIRMTKPHKVSIEAMRRVIDVAIFKAEV